LCFRLTHTPILNFSWNDNTKITDSDYGIDAISGFGQYITGRVGGTLSLAPITSLKPI
jgi:hypothetical protein